MFEMRQWKPLKKLLSLLRSARRIFFKSVPKVPLQRPSGLNKLYDAETERTNEVVPETEPWTPAPYDPYLHDHSDRFIKHFLDVKAQTERRIDRLNHQGYRVQVRYTKHT